MTQQNKNNLPLVSILMTIYNAEHYLKEAIDSILAQTFSNWELIAVENGSTDQSPLMLSHYDDPRVQVFVLRENIGRTPALQYAFEQARGEYIAILDADDVSHPVRLERQVEYLNRYPEVGLVGAWSEFIDEYSHPFEQFKPPTDRKKLYDSLGWTNPIIHSSTMYRRELARRVGAYSNQFTYAQDYGLLLMLARHCSIAMLDEFLCRQRVLSTQMTSARKYQRIIAEEQIYLLQYASAVLSLSPLSQRLNRRSQAVAEIRLGIVSALEGKWLKGLVQILISIIRKPSALWGNGPVRRFFGARV